MKSFWSRIMAAIHAASARNIGTWGGSMRHPLLSAAANHSHFFMILIILTWPEEPVRAGPLCDVSPFD
jgi:hypothetical protein